MSSVNRSFSQILREYEGAAWLTLILIVATWLRFRGLDFQSYWFDELFSAHYSRPDHDIATVVTLTLGDVHPPFYQLMMWLSYQVLGFTEWAGRLPSAVAGVLTIPGVYLLGRELFGRRAGLYAAALATVNFYLLYYSQEARSYAFLYALCIWSFVLFVRALRSDSQANLWAYVGVTLLLLYTHYFGFVLLLAEGLAALIYLQRTGWQQRGTLVRAGVAVSVIVVCVLPIIPAMLGHAAIDEFWISQPGPGFIIGYFRSYFASPWLALAVAVVCLAGVGGFFAGGQSDWQRTGVLMLLAWVVLGYALPWLRGLSAQPVITDRNTIMQVPALLVLAGYGLTVLPGVWLQRAALAFLVAYSSWLLLVNQNYYGFPKKQQYRETAQALGNFQPQLPVYTLSFNESKYNVYFSQQGSGLVAVAATELETQLADDAAPPLLWLAGGHLYSPQADVAEAYGLVEVGRVAHRSTAAALLVNPANAVQLTLQPGPAEPAAVYSTARLPRSAFPLQLLVAANAATRAEFSGEIGIELLALDGRVISSYANAPGALPIVLPLGLVTEDTSLRVLLPAGQPEPEVWLVP